jgi:hypothetical protein
MRGAIRRPVNGERSIKGDFEDEVLLRIASDSRESSSWIGRRLLYASCPPTFLRKK